MSIAIIALLGSALIHPFWIAIPKKAVHPLTANFLMMILIGVVFSPILFREDLWMRLSEYWFEYSILCTFQTLYTILVLTFAKNHHFQVAYPLSRTGPLLILFGEIYFLQGVLNLQQIIGIVAVTLGAMLFGFDKHLREVRSKFFLLLVGVVFSMSGSMIMTKKLITIFSPAEFWALSVFQIPLLALFVFRKKKELRQELKNPKLILAGAIAMVSTWYLAMIAIAELPASVVSAVRNLSIVFGIFLGGKMFQEGHNLKRYFAGGMIVCGAIISLL